MVVDTRRRWTVRLLVLLMPFVRLLRPPRGTQVLGLALHTRDGSLLRLRAEGQRQTSLEALSWTVRLLVVLMKEVMQLATRALGAGFQASGRAAARTLLDQQLLAHHAPETIVPLPQRSRSLGRRDDAFVFFYRSLPYRTSFL
jgi:hypothetical protein